MAPPADDYPLPGHPDVATVLVYAADDEFFEPDWERFMARELLGIEPIEIPAGISRWPKIPRPSRSFSIAWRASTGAL